MREREDRGGEENWNLGTYYFQTLGEIDQVATLALLRKDLRSCHDAFAVLFLKTSPYCWKAPDDPEHVEFKKKLDEMTTRIYREGGPDAEEESELFDNLQELMQEYYWVLKKHEVLSPVRVRPDPWNSPQ